MISYVKSVIISKLQELYPAGYTIYDEDLPENISKPSFLIKVVNQNYSKRLNNKFNSILSFEVTYFSSQAAVRTDCISIQENLLQSFDLLNTFRIANKIAKITDNVLHFTFDIRYSEIREKQYTLMQHQQTNTKL